jgi:hypothetical protein
MAGMHTKLKPKQSLELPQQGVIITNDSDVAVRLTITKMARADKPEGNSHDHEEEK